jgi:hypothetical protein
MLAWSKNDQIKKMTQAAIDSLHASSTEYKFNVLVMETSKDPVSYAGHRSSARESLSITILISTSDSQSANRIM